jgi:hypothetical protein
MCGLVLKGLLIPDTFTDVIDHADKMTRRAIIELDKNELLFKKIWFGHKICIENSQKLTFGENCPIF